MSARTWWSARTGSKPAETNTNRAEESPDLPIDELLDARFDEEGRLAHLGHGKSQRTAERLDTRPPLSGGDELDIAVQKLSEGLEAIERQSREARTRASSIRPETLDAPPEPSEAGGRDFVTYSLDRLEARLEALSRRLQQRAGGGAGAGVSAAAPSSGARRSVSAPIAADEADRAAQLAESRRLAEAEEARRVATEAAEKARQAEAAAEARFEAERARSEAEQARREAEQARRQAEAVAEVERRREAETAAEVAEAKREVEAAEARRRSEVAEVRRQAELVEAKRQAEVAEVRRQAEAAETRRRAEAEAAAEERRRLAEEAEAIRLADLAEARRNAEVAEARHRAEAEEARRHADEARRQAEISAARREAEMAARIERQFAEIESRIEGLQSGLDENQIEPVRGELLELVQQISELSRGGRATSGALDEIGIRLDQMDVKLNAARNMAGNRLGDIQDKLSGLVERLDEIEVEIPGFDAIRVNQSAILERFDRMEGLVTHIASPEELFERVDALKRQMQTVASQREVVKIEEQILRLTERLDALPDDLSDKVVLGRIEEQLGGLAAEFLEARRQRKSVATELEDHLSELSAQLRDVAETGRTPDLSGIEERVSRLASQIADDRTATADTLTRLEQRLGALAGTIEGQEDEAAKTFTRLEQRLGALTDAIENQEDEATKALLETLTTKVDALAGAIDAQDSPGARRDIEGLGSRLEQLSAHIAERTEHLSRRQLEPLAERLVAIEERIANLASRAPDPRALQTQIEGIVSRLELLKGRSIDPARLNELFDRVDAAVRAVPEERFDRLEQRLDDAIAPAERFDRLEKKVAEAAASAATTERFTNLERKLDEISRVFTAGGDLLTQEDLTELRSDIVALRRELRSGLGQGEQNLGDLLRTLVARLDQLPQGTPVTAADLEAQMERITRILDDPSQGRTGLVHIETSLKAIEQRLEETRHSLERSNLEGDEAAAAGAKMESVAGLARSLSDDVTVLKSTTQATEKKTRDAIDAVQDTLEAVVKRMAFLERDADAAARTGARDPVPARRAEPPVVAEREPEPEEEIRSAAEPETAEAPEVARALEAPEVVVDEPRTVRDTSDQTPGGLLSRLTSRQLLKRATGGRAESFTPEAEESDDASDFPLEPGTDAPLSSSLTGAPSSNTEFMSGARKGRSIKPFAAEHGAAGRDEIPAAVDDDFLAAARRAARAAAQESPEEGVVAPVEQKPRGFFRRHRRSLLGVAIAAALIIAAIPFLRPELWPTGTEIASLPAPAVPAAEPEASSSPETATAEPEASIPALASAETSTTAQSSASTETSVPTESLAAAPELSSAEPPVAATPDLRPEDTAAATQAPEGETQAAAPSEATTPAPGSDVAAVAASTTPETGTPPAASAPAVTMPEATTPMAGAQPLNLPPLPDSIGSAKLRDAAMAGDNAAAFEVAARYAEGRGVLPDMTTSVLWYLKAAEAGLAPAQYRLGSIYEKGLGVPKDLVAAQKWYGRAAEAGNVKAMHNLAVLYAEGAGGAPNLEKASALFRQAAERGVRDSQFNLAILHARGLGVPQDLVEAYKWFGIAASSGDEESAKRRDIIGEALSSGDKERAEQAIATFQPTPLSSEANEVVMPEGGWSDGNSSTGVDAGDQQQLVALVQKLLAQNGYDPGPADGKLGNKTIDAITAFQTKAGLPKTGKIDSGLVAALQDKTT